MIITFDELHHCLQLDPYYGIEAAATDSLINSIYRNNVDNDSFENFAEKFSLLPCKSDQQRHLIYLWCGLMGLQSYRDGTPLSRWRKDFLDTWTQDFELRLDDLKDFLRQHSWPLPVAFFPNEVDNTEQKVALGDAAFEAAFQNFAVKLPQLEDELAELRRIQPESMRTRQQKKIEIEKIEQQIAAIYSGNNKNSQETPSERKQRLNGWFQEEKRLKGERGALQRTADREGIKRQTLSDILKR